MQFSANVPSSADILKCALARFAASSTSQFEVDMPTGLKASDKFKALLPDAQAVLVAVPPKASPGAVITFKVPNYVASVA